METTNEKIQKYDICYVDFGDSANKGSEQGGIRPAIVVSNNLGNEKGPIVIVCPITTQNKTRLPQHLRLNTYDFLDRKSMVLLEQIITKDKRFVLHKIGKLNEADSQSVDRLIKISLNLNSDCSSLTQSLIEQSDELKELYGFIKFHIIRTNDMKSIEEDIIIYNDKLRKYKQFCYSNHILSEDYYKHGYIDI